jgi:uncharacterized phage protein (TIGR02220 family)
MAQGRMLRKDICESDSFATLKDSNAQLLCCLLTPWWDDHGKMIGDPQWIKGNIVRKLGQFTEKEIIRCLELIDKCLDVQWWSDEKGNKWLYWSKFDNYQTISEEKKTKDNLPSPKIPKNPQESSSTSRSISRSISRREGEIGDFFNYFLLKTKKTLKLTSERKAIIEKRLNEGRTLEELKQAVDNFINDDWQDRHKYIDIVYCLGVRNKVDNLDKWLMKKVPKKYQRDPLCKACDKDGLLPDGKKCWCWSLR